MTESMAKDREAKKRNFTQCEVEVLVGEVEMRKAVLFGGHGVWVTNVIMAACGGRCQCCCLRRLECGQSKKKVVRYKSRCKKKKKHLAAHRQSVCATGGGTGQPELTPLDEKLTGILGESLLSGVVTEVEEVTNAGPQGAEDPDMSFVFPHLSENQMHSSCVHIFMYRTN